MFYTYVRGGSSDFAQDAHGSDRGSNSNSSSSSNVGARFRVSSSGTHGCDVHVGGVPCAHEAVAVIGPTESPVRALLDDPNVTISRNPAGNVGLCADHMNASAMASRGARMDQGSRMDPMDQTNHGAAGAPTGARLSTSAATLPSTCSAEHGTYAAMVREVMRQTEGANPTVQRAIMADTSRRLLEALAKMGVPMTAESIMGQGERIGAEFHQNLTSLHALSQQDPSVMAPERVIKEYETTLSDLTGAFEQARRGTVTAAQSQGLASMAEKAASVHSVWKEYMDIATGPSMAVTADRARQVSQRAVGTLTEMTVAKAYTQGAMAAAMTSASGRSPYESQSVSALGIFVQGSLGAMIQWMAEDRAYRLLGLSGYGSDPSVAKRAEAAVEGLRGKPSFAQGSTFQQDAIQDALGTLQRMKRDPSSSSSFVAPAGAPTLSSSAGSPNAGSPSALDQLDSLRNTVDYTRTLQAQMTQNSMHDQARAAATQFEVTKDAFDAKTNELATMMSQQNATGQIVHACPVPELAKALNDPEMSSVAKLGVLLQARLGTEWIKNSFGF